jgi:hypothetical protein
LGPTSTMATSRFQCTPPAASVLECALALPLPRPSCQGSKVINTSDPTPIIRSLRGTRYTYLSMSAADRTWTAVTCCAAKAFGGGEREEVSKSAEERRIIESVSKWMGEWVAKLSLDSSYLYRIRKVATPPAALLRGSTSRFRREVGIRSSRLPNGCVLGLLAKVWHVAELSRFVARFEHSNRVGGGRGAPHREICPPPQRQRVYSIVLEPVMKSVHIINET